LAHSGRRGARLEIEVAGDPDSSTNREAVDAKFCRYAARTLGERRALGAGTDAGAALSGD